MIKVFLVEDEIIIRNGIKNSINWEMHGYDFVGEASAAADPQAAPGHPDHGHQDAFYGWTGTQ